MGINTSAGARVFIGPTTSADDESSYAALSYVEIGEIETIGEFGDKSAAVNFTALKDGRVRKLKGAKDAGDVAITCGHDPLDVGQIAAKAASDTKFAYAFKVVLDDSADANDTDSVFYFHAKVMAAPMNIGGNNDVTKRLINLAIDTAIVEVLSVTV